MPAQRKLDYYNNNNSTPNIRTEYLGKGSTPLLGKGSTLFLAKGLTLFLVKGLTLLLGKESRC